MKKILVLIGLVLNMALVALADAAQLAPNYGAAQTYACNGAQHDIGFALDYNAPMYIRHIEMVVTGALPGQYGTVTFSISVPPGQAAPFIAGFGGVETSAHVDFGINGWHVPAAQALALEFSCAGGGSRTLIVTLGYTANAGPNP
jgi:hypothetical protein